MPSSDRVSKRRLGVHTSISGGLYLAIERAKKLGCTTIQIFSHNPRQWDIAHIPDEDVQKFKKLRTKYDIDPVFIHASYLINLCSEKSEIYAKSVDLLEKELDIADIISADYVVLHPGSSSKDDLNRVRKKTISALKYLSNRKKWNAQILLENTAGRRSDISSRIEPLSQMLNEVSNDLIGGICIDTSHAYAAGYNLEDNNGLSDFIIELKTYIGLHRLKLIHFNDSKKPCNSKVDRHEHIGKGHIGKDAMKRFLTHPAFNSIPVILETPKKSERDDIMNLKTVKGFYNQS